MRLGIAMLVLVAVSGVARADDATPLSYTTPLSPTGELVPRGRFEHIQSGTILHHDVAMGITDGLEVRLGMPLLPLPILGGDLQVRAAVLPSSSRLRVVLGVGAMAEWINGADLYPSASATVAWRGERWNVHATARVVAHHGEGRERGLWNNVGVTWKAGTRTTLFAEAGQFAWTEPGGSCTDKHGVAHPCTTRDAIDGVIVGVWWQLRDMGIGLMGLVAHHDDDVLPILPLLSFRHER